MKGSARGLPSTLVLSLFLLSGSVVSSAQETESPSPGQERNIAKIASEYEDFAGSGENADALVRGLRTGSDISLSGEGGGAVDLSGLSGRDALLALLEGGGTDVDVEVEVENSEAYGFGNVSHALMLAEAQLNALGIDDPTPEQIQQVLRDGLEGMDAGILDMREDGMGWGEISQELGFKLGELKSAKKPGHDGVGPAAAKVAKLEKSARPSFEKPVKPAKPEKPAKVEKPQRPEKILRPERPQRPEKVSRPERPQRPEKIAKPERPPKPERPDRPGRG